MRNIKFKQIVISVTLLLGMTSCSKGSDFTVNKIGMSKVDANARTIDGKFGSCINGKSYQQDAVISHRGYQYIAYYDGNKQVCVGRRKLPKGSWQIIRFKDYEFKSDDGHNMFSMGICPQDGTLHLSFDHHASKLNYRSSVKGVASKPEAVTWEASLFGPIKSKLNTEKELTRVTYPRFWQTPKGGLQFSYRSGGSGNGVSMLIDYDANTGTWSGLRQINSGKGLFRSENGDSKSRNAYPNGYTYGPRNKLHTTWVWREGSKTANRNLMYAYSEDHGVTWKNNEGQKIKGLPAIDSPGITVAKISQDYGLSSMHCQAVDSQGHIHAVMVHCSDKSFAAAGSKPGEHRWGLAAARRYQHYWRDSAGKWQHTELPWVAGNRAKIFFDGKHNLYLVYGEKHTVTGTKKYYGPLNLCIAVATPDAKYKDWKVIHREKGSFFNEMLIDPSRWDQEKILSVMVQEYPKKPWQSTPLHVLDFAIKGK